MADKTLSQVISSGGGSFVTRFISGGLTIPSGQTGTLFTITPPSGQRVRITSLTTDSATNDEPGISLEIDGNTVTDTGLLLSRFGSGGGTLFGVANSLSGSGAAEGFTMNITSGQDEIVSLVKTGGNTSQTIVYSYEFGE